MVTVKEMMLLHLMHQVNLGKELLLLILEDQIQDALSLTLELELIISLKILLKDQLFIDAIIHQVILLNY